MKTKAYWKQRAEDAEAEMRRMCDALYDIVNAEGIMTADDLYELLDDVLREFDNARCNNRAHNLSESQRT